MNINARTSADDRRHGHGMILAAPIALAALIGVAAALVAAVMIARALWSRDVRLPAVIHEAAFLQETSTMVIFAAGVLAGFLLALLLVGFLLIARLLLGQPGGSGGFPLPFPAPPGLPSFPFPFPPPPGFDPAKFLECLCRASHGPGGGGGGFPGENPPNPWDVARGIWGEIGSLRERADDARKGAERLKEQFDTAVQNAGANASDALKDGQKQAGALVEDLGNAGSSLVEAGAGLLSWAPNNDR